MKLLHDIRPPNRPVPTFLQVINPWFWLCDTERNMKWSWWQWFKRNPFHNFKAVILGVSHKERTCYYKCGWTYPPYGWNFGYITIKRSFLPLPFIAHRGDKYEYALGWMTSGTFATTFRRENSPNATFLPT